MDENLNNGGNMETETPGGDAGTNPEAGQGAGTGGTGGDGGGASSDWRAGLPDGWADRLKDVKDADEAMKALERGLSYRPAEKADDITLKFPDSFKGQVDEGVQKNFREFCVKEGLTAGQAQALLDWQLGANREILEKIIEDGTKTLKDAWGSRFDENRDTALKAFTALDRRMNGELSGSVAGRNMANDPVFVRAFHEIGKLLSEDTLSGGSGGASSDGRENAEDTYKNMFKE